MGLGDFVGGLQSGMGTMQDLQSRRQQQKLRDYSLKQYQTEDAAAADASMQGREDYISQYGEEGAPAAYEPLELQDPYILRFGNFLSSKMGKGKKKSASTAGVPAGEMVTTEEIPEGTYADGGEVKGPPARNGRVKALDIPERSSAFKRGNVNERRVRYGDPSSTVGLGSKERFYADGGSVDYDERLQREMHADRLAYEAEQKAARMQKLKNVGSRAIRLGAKPAGPLGALKGTGVGILAGAGMAGALQGAGTPTEEYYERMGWDPREAGLSFWKDIGARTLGVLGDVGDAIPGVGFIKNKMGLGRDAAPEEAAPEEAAPEEAAPEEMEQPMALPVSTAGQRGSAGGGARSAPTSSDRAGPQPGDAIDLSGIDLNEEEMPNLNEKDWRDFRKQALRQAVIKGIPHTEAKAAADDAVAKIQMRGFNQYAQQAAALLGAGNVNGAKRSLKAAYQYFPDGNDVKFAVKNGKLLAIGVDEQTGQPFDGGTHVITPEYLAGAIQNFSNPQNFLAWTKDWRDEQFKRDVNENQTKKLQQAQINAYNTNADARLTAAEAAEAAEARAAAAGGASGMKQSDLRGSSQIFMKALEERGLDNPQEARQLAGIMAQVKLAAPGIPEAMIIDKVMEAAEAGTLPQLIQRLQQRSGAAPAQRPAAPAAPQHALPARPPVTQRPPGFAGGISPQAAADVDARFGGAAYNPADYEPAR